MVVAAINEANRKCDEAMKSKLGSMLPWGWETFSNSVVEWLYLGFH
jgi:hypothetical protein